MTVIAFKEVGILPLLPPTEAMLSVQMIAAHEAALLFLKRATLQDQTMEGSDANVLRATRLMRVFNEQIEVMQKSKGKAGQQKVTGEHVHVHEGGQAIVGAVSAAKADRGRGQVNQSEQTPHEARRGCWPQATAASRRRSKRRYCSPAPNPICFHYGFMAVPY